MSELFSQIQLAIADSRIGVPSEITFDRVSVLFQDGVISVLVDHGIDATAIMELVC